MTNEYIKKSDVLEILNNCSRYFENDGAQYDLIDEVSELPTINPVKILEQMIEEDLNSYDKAYYPILEKAIARIYN